MGGLYSLKTSNFIVYVHGKLYNRNENVIDYIDFDGSKSVF